MPGSANSTSWRKLNGWAVAAVAAVGLGCACGGGGGNVPAQGPELRPTEGSTPDAGQPAVGSNPALVDELLHHQGASDAALAAAGTGRAGSAPDTEPGPILPSASEERLDTFDEDMARIRQTVPGWDNGTGVTVKFLKESTGGRLSLIFVDPTPPVFQQRQGLWMIQGRATADRQTLGHIVLLLKSLAPGRYEGSPTKKDVVVAVLMGEQWDGKDPETTWSINQGSWAELTLREGRNPGDLEGDFRGRLVDNQGTGYHTIEAGYIYVNR